MLDTAFYYLPRTGVETLDIAPTRRKKTSN